MRILLKQSTPVLAMQILAALVGMALVIYATSYGPGVGGDATIYLTSAKNLIAGKGLGWTEADGSFRLLPYTPPFYPLALSAVGLVFADIVAGARWLNVLLFGATIILMGWQLYRASGHAWLAGIFSGVIATSPVLLGVQVWAMSESLAIFLGFAGLAILLNDFERKYRVALFASALLVGLSFLSRYIAVAFVATGCLAFILFDPSEPGSGEALRRGLARPGISLRGAVLYGLLAILPMLVWLVIDFSITGTVGSRSGQPAEAYWQRFLEIGPALQKIYLFWLLPESIIARLPGIVQVLLWLGPLAALAGLTLWSSRRRAYAASDPLPGQVLQAGRTVRLAQLYALFTAVYLVVLVIVQVFTYPPITLASRMLAPVHLAVLALIFSLLSLGLRAFERQTVHFALSPRLAFVLVHLSVLVLLGSYALRSLLIARDDHRTGIGYTAPAWQKSATIAAVREIPKDVPIISNETTAVMFLLDRPAYPLQEIYQDRPLETFVAYGEGDDESQRVFREKGGALVLFDAALQTDFAMYGEQTEERLAALKQGLYRYYHGDDGSIYFNEHPAFQGDCNCRLK